MAGESLFDVVRVMRLAMTCRVSSILAALFVTALLELIIGDQVGLFPSRLLALVTARNQNKFWHTTLEYTLFIGTEVGFLVLSEWMSDQLAVTLKGLLVRALHRKYLNENTFYKLQIYNPEIDNPDARIAQDCTNFALDFCLTLRQCVKTPIIAVWYSIRVWREIGAWAVYCSYGFGCFWMILCRLTMIPVIKLTYSFEAKQAAFRGHHIRTRDSSEVVCLSQAQDVEKKTLNAKLQDVLQQQTKLAVWGIPLNVVTFMYVMLNNGVTFFWFYVFPPKDGKPNETAALISRVSFVLIMLLSSIGSVFDVLSDVSRLCGYASRIYELFTVVSMRSEPQELVAPEIGDEVGLDHADIVVPGSGRVILRDLTFRVGKGDSLFVSGPSGCGKSSIFRVLGRLWPLTNGKLMLSTNMMFLPQKAYVKYKSFDDAVTFPNTETFDRDRFKEVMDFLDLWHIRKRTITPWYKGLSPGERQKIALARVFLHQPDFVLLDEATCAIPQSLEEQVFSRLADMGISFISIPHRHSLRKYHTHSLDIMHNGDWKFSKNTPDENLIQF